MKMKNDAKFQEEFDCSVQNWDEKFDEFWSKHSKVPKMCTLMGYFWPKYSMFELNKV